MAKSLMLFTTILLLVSIWSLAQEEPEPIAPHVPSSFGEFILTPQATSMSVFPTPFYATQAYFPTHSPTKPPSVLPPLNGTMNNKNEVLSYGNFTDTITWAIGQLARLYP